MNAPLHLIKRPAKGFSIPKFCIFAFAMLFANLLFAGEAIPSFAENAPDPSPLVYPLPLQSYPSADTLWETLCQRVKIEPLNLYVSVIFLCAVIHTFCYRMFLRWSASIKNKDENLSYVSEFSDGSISMLSRLFKLLGEVEIIFALWLIPLFGLICWFYGYHTLADYLDKLVYIQDKYSEPLFVVVIMCIASTRPVIQFAMGAISKFAKLGGSTVGAWWLAILIVGPVLGSFITEPAAITICAMLLIEKFFRYKPGNALKYATIALLFVSISVGGTLTHFSAPPVLMVAKTWNWDFLFMLQNFGIKAVVGILIATVAYFLLFRREFKSLQRRHEILGESKDDSEPAPKWIVFANLIFLTCCVFLLHYPVILIFLFLAFLGFSDITSSFQPPVKYRNPILVGIFLAALVTHGSLQAWWIEPILMSMEDKFLFLGTIILTAFNDNAAITYLASLVPDFSDNMKYMVLSGAVSGGGLTVIANAPNLAGLSVLKKNFRNGLSPLDLLIWAAAPTLIMSLLLFFWR